MHKQKKQKATQHKNKQIENLKEKKKKKTFQREFVHKHTQSECANLHWNKAPTKQKKTSNFERAFDEIYYYTISNATNVFANISIKTLTPMKKNIL